jgi:hypothetical protein
MMAKWLPLIETTPGKRVSKRSEQWLETISAICSNAGLQRCSPAFFTTTMWLDEE